MADNPSPFDPARILAHKFPETTSTYTERDVALYALGIGVCCQEAVDADELKYVYNENGQEYIKVLPTFSALFIHDTMRTGLSLPGLSFDPKLALHGQQYIELYKPLPSSGYLENKVSLAGLHDKGKAAILEIATKSYDKKSGQLLCMNRTSLFLRGAGGFSSSSHPFSYTNYPKDQGLVGKIPKTPPFTVYEDYTGPSQALLYSLSGDYNPLHSDPVVAKIAGFSKPILHGLCTLGFAVRAVIKCVCKGDLSKIKCLLGKFLLHVYPGEILVTEMWLEGSRVLYQTKVKERNRAVLSGYVDLHHVASSL
ncbi:enoyl-CoA hydratase 2, peroxisomal [Benincasa hispida]|uniref:enoyl-CoA hydratase 2, peroxisomal n=1 Tax=Benincasa hispida TaxID=102211 RepID=UPI0019012DCB|nr:enoyl-CoA hydratase 2, peroxisomal [Benincasa hispida]